MAFAATTMNVWDFLFAVLVGWFFGYLAIPGMVGGFFHFLNISMHRCGR